MDVFAVAPRTYNLCTVLYFNADSERTRQYGIVWNGIRTIIALHRIASQGGIVSEHEHINMLGEDQLSGKFIVRSSREEESDPLNMNEQASSIITWNADCLMGTGTIAQNSILNIPDTIGPLSAMAFETEDCMDH